MPVEQVTTVAGGGATCEYMVPKDASSVGAANENNRDRAVAGLLPVVQMKGAAARR